ncbi:hypothetical protein L1987_51288 [Smallanthus sonchifolius]|uniref:Uncharacterized protein n=1 Tax=Smallanthus sonchifolius TaxID=185202 RepID=A0ACB9ER17_9ASTR|nr:hypothetical protein L1987_51288 [Smallanthus sonchifolius]
MEMNSVSQDYIFNLSHGFERPSQDKQEQDDHIAHQIERGKLRMQGFEGLEDEGSSGMLSEMFNFPTELVHNQTLHMLLPNTVPSSSPTLHHQQSFGPSSQFAWIPPGGGGGEIHGLSLSLSSTLQHLEAAKVEGLRIGDDPASGMLYFNQGGFGGSDLYRNMQFMGPTHHPSTHVGYGSSSLGVVKGLRSSRYVKAAQELLEEFCSVGRGELKINKSRSKLDTNQNPSNSEGDDCGASSSSLKDLAPLSSAERMEHQRRKSTLLSMLDEASQSLPLPLSKVFLEIME